MIEAPPSELPLTPPPHGILRVVPLGGLGEIGMNCLALEQEDAILIVDCGITFPEDDIGIETYHPDFSYLEARRDRVVGVFLTHGHEDHVGALPYLLAKLRVPVWGPAHALAVARHRIADRGQNPRDFEFITTTVRKRYMVGPFEVEPIRVTHSITDATALAIRTDAGTVIHTGDFRFDPTPADGELTDEARLIELGDEGVRLLMSDSTNIDSQGRHLSEQVVGETLERLVGAADQRVIIGMFASNLQRLKMIGDLAQRTGRKIALFGRSIELQVQWGHEIKRLDWPSDLVVARDHAKDLPRPRVLILAGGTQAEPGSSLARLATRVHPSLSLDAGDTVIFSSRVIPGNDRPVYAMMADLLRQGVKVESWISEPTVHTSGHAHRVEQQQMIELIRPRAFIPLHGTRHHLERHASARARAGVPDIMVFENGDVAKVTREELAPGGHVDVGRVATWRGHPLGSSVLAERRSLGRGGALSLSVALDAKGRLAGPPSVVARGVIDGEGQPGNLRFIALEVSRAIERSPSAMTSAWPTSSAWPRAAPSKTRPVKNRSAWSA